MRKILIMLVMLMHITLSQAFDIKVLKVDFDTSVVTYNNENYTLVEVKQKVKFSHREITYLCYNEKLQAVAFRLFVKDDGSYIKLQRYVGRK